MDPLQREGHAGVGAPLWRGAYGGGSRPSVSLCGRRSLRGSVTGRVCVWEGRLSILSQGDQHWPPEVRPWAGPWRVGQPGQLPRGRGVPGQGGGRGWCRGPGVWGGQGSAGPHVSCGLEVDGGASAASRGDSWRWLFRRSLRGCQSQHQCRPRLWFCALHGDEATEETVLGWGLHGHQLTR